MNLRIRELAEQAGLIDYFGICVEDEEDSKAVEKFAELILRECLSYAKDSDLDFMKFMIKKHFGVRE